MKRRMRHELGFSAFEGILTIVVFSLIAVGGFFIYQRTNDNGEEENRTYSEQMIDEAAPITSTEELEAASAQLEAINIEELDTSELETIENELL